MTGSREGQTKPLCRRLERRSLTAAQLATAIDEALASSSMQERARQPGEKIRAEGGVAQTVQAIERYPLRRVGG